MVIPNHVTIELDASVTAEGAHYPKYNTVDYVLDSGISHARL